MTLFANGKKKISCVNLSRKDFKLRVNKMSANSTFSAVTSAYVSKTARRNPVYVSKQIRYKQLGNISFAQTQAQVGV